MVGQFTPKRRRERGWRIQFSDGGRYGAFAHRKVPYFSKVPYRQRRLFQLLLIPAFLIGFAVTVTFTRAVLLPPRTVEAQSRSIPICSGWDRASSRATCLVDGDTGWENGVKWRLSAVDAPEITSPGCASERQQGLAARDRLQGLMAAGYAIRWLGATDRYNRELVDITLSDGRDAGRVLIWEGLARTWPNGAKKWCNR
jgi:endonuclease YncB( thermonuclease family)